MTYTRRHNWVRIYIYIYSRMSRRRDPQHYHYAGLICQKNESTTSKIESVYAKILSFMWQRQFRCNYTTILLPSHYIGIVDDKRNQKWFRVCWWKRVTVIISSLKRKELLFWCKSIFNESFVIRKKSKIDDNKLRQILSTTKNNYKHPTGNLELTKRFRVRK